MYWLRYFWRVVVLGKRWQVTYVKGVYHHHPAHDLMRHEAVDCVCGPEVCDCEEECGDVFHWSLDAREGMR